MNNTENSSSYYDHFWHFVENNLPDYHHRDDVLADDILFRYLDGDDVDVDDLEWIARDFGNDREKVRQYLVDQESRFAREALEAYFTNCFNRLPESCEGCTEGMTARFI